MTWLVAVLLTIAQVCACKAAYEIGRATGTAEAGARYLAEIERRSS